METQIKNSHFDCRKKVYKVKQIAKTNVENMVGSSNEKVKVKDAPKKRKGKVKRKVSTVSNAF